MGRQLAPKFSDLEGHNERQLRHTRSHNENEHRYGASKLAFDRPLCPGLAASTATATKKIIIRPKVNVSLLHPTGDVAWKYKSLLTIGRSGFVPSTPEQFECILKPFVQAIRKIFAETDFDQPHRSRQQAECTLSPAENLIFKALDIYFDENLLAIKSCIRDKIQSANRHVLIPFIGRRPPNRAQTTLKCCHRTAG